MSACSFDFISFRFDFSFFFYDLWCLCAYARTLAIFASLSIHAYMYIQTIDVYIFFFSIWPMCMCVFIVFVCGRTDKHKHKYKYKFIESYSECTHAHQQPSCHSAKQSNGKRINTSETVGNALSKGTATEIGTKHSVKSACRHNCNNNNNNTSVCFETSADALSKAINRNMSNRQEERDRLGLWGNDTEVAAAVSGLERMHLARFNKV